MVECIFTLDYELYGDGTGSLAESVCEPAARLRDLFLKHGVRFVNFVEVAELEKIERHGTDRAIGRVHRQIRELYEDGFEIGLHLHSQWCNARYEAGRWMMDASEYNLCTLPRPRIEEILDRSLEHLRQIVGVPRFTPLSFRAGNWLFQPSQPAASVLHEKGIVIDSSLFKGGVLQNHGLDYRRSLANGPYWRFEADVNTEEPGGIMLEIPIFTRMVPFWRMATAKRMRIDKSSANAKHNSALTLKRARDLLRLRYPLKLDFCRMNLREMTSAIEAARLENRRNGIACQPVVAIGHTKDLIDLDTVSGFLSFLNASRIRTSTFAAVVGRLDHGAQGRVRVTPSEQPS